MTRRHFIKLSAAGAAGAGAIGLYSWRVEPHWLEVVLRKLPISGLPSNLVGARLVQISDLHIGPRVDDSYLKRCFQRVKDLAAEFVVYTGDFTTYADDVFAHARRMFSFLPLGSRGTFGILGNHDYGPRWSHPEVAREIASMASDVGIRLLRNESVDVGGLQIAGLDELWAGQCDLLTTLKEFRPGAAALVLTHNPDTADLPGWGAYSGWILAGHTHGGQCKPPFLPPPLLPVQNRRYTAGEFQLAGGRRLYINRGVGHLLTVRFNVRPEVTVFSLEQTI